MPLGLAIQNAIADVGYNNAEVIRKCEELGVYIDKSTFSKIVTGTIKKPNLESLKAIAKVCNVNINKLLIERDFDNSPQSIKDILINLKLKTSNIIENITENKFEDNIKKGLRKKIERETMADFLIDILKMKEEFDINNLLIREDNNENSLTNIFSKLKISIGVTIDDNGMNPIVPKDSQVSIELKSKEEYNPNDIFLIKIKKYNKFFARYVRFDKDKIILYTINTNYSIEEYEEDEISILGKIVSVTNKI